MEYIAFKVGEYEQVTEEDGFALNISRHTRTKLGTWIVRQRRLQGPGQT